MQKIKQIDLFYRICAYVLVKWKLVQNVVKLLKILSLYDIVQALAAYFLYLFDVITHLGTCTFYIAGIYLI